jgi:hypothetical protein
LRRKKRRVAYHVWLTTCGLRYLQSCCRQTKVIHLDIVYKDSSHQWTNSQIFEHELFDQHRHKTQQLGDVHSLKCISSLERRLWS